MKSGGDGQRRAREAVLAPGANCQRVDPAARFAFLMENEAYFRALASSLEKARRSIMILGWQFDPRTRLDPESRIGDRAAEIGVKLRALKAARPELEIRLLVWSSPWIIAASQQGFPHRAQAWFINGEAELRLEPSWRLGGCHHQKAVIIDDAVAFCGGGDISTDRWDSEAHLDEDVRRYTPSGRPSAPRHEMMCVMDGPAARALGDLARERWREARGERLEPVDGLAADPATGAAQGSASPSASLRTSLGDPWCDPWPDDVEPHLHQAPVGLMRTEPSRQGRPAVRENERFYLDAIRRAKHLIYLENQYFTSPLIAQALADRLAEPDGPEVVLVTTGQSPSWFDRLTMDTARSEVLYRLEQADRRHRFFAFSPWTAGGRRIVVHGKTAVFDDRLIRIGSTNLNNRSLGFDTECDVAVEPADEEGRAAIRRFRQHAIGHFIGVDGPAFSRVEAALGSVGRALEQFSGERMRPLGAVPPNAFERWIAEWQFGDPRGAEDAWRPWKRLNRSHRRL